MREKRCIYSISMGMFKRKRSRMRFIKEDTSIVVIVHEDG